MAHFICDYYQFIHFPPFHGRLEMLFVTVGVERRIESHMEVTTPRGFRASYAFVKGW